MKKIKILLIFVIEVILIGCSSDDGVNKIPVVPDPVVPDSVVDVDTEKLVFSKEGYVEIKPEDKEAIATIVWYSAFNKETILNRIGISYEIRYKGEVIKTVFDNGEFAHKYEYTFGKLEPNVDYVFTLTAKYKSGNDSDPHDIKVSYNPEKLTPVLKDLTFEENHLGKHDGYLLRWEYENINYNDISHMTITKNGETITKKPLIYKEIEVSAEDPNTDYTFTITLETKYGIKSNTLELKINRFAPVGSLDLGVDGEHLKFNYLGDSSLEKIGYLAKLRKTSSGVEFISVKPVISSSFTFDSGKKGKLTFRIGFDKFVSGNEYTIDDEIASKMYIQYIDWKIGGIEYEKFKSGTIRIDTISKDKLVATIKGILVDKAGKNSIDFNLSVDADVLK